MAELDLPERYYPNEFPETGAIVMAKIIKIGESSVECFLPEYNRNAMLSFNEISKKKVRNLRRFIRVGNQECMEVIDVDEEKGYIDVSRKMIKNDERTNCEESFVESKRIHSFFHRWSKKAGNNLITDLLWEYFDDEEDTPYSNLIEDLEWCEDLPETIRENLRKDFTKSFQKKPKRLESQFQMICYSQEGVAALQEAIDAGLEQGTDDVPLQCTMTGSTGNVGSIFILSSISSSDESAEVMKKALDTMQSTLRKYYSNFVIN